MAQAIVGETILECTFNCGPEQKEVCPLVTGEYKNLENSPCCNHLWIPSRHQHAATGKNHIVNKSKAVRLFLKELEDQTS